MLPTIEELERHLIEKMTNEDIAKLYRVSYQKIIQLTKKYNLNPSKLRKVDTFIVYEHWIDGEVVYVGSGQW